VNSEIDQLSLPTIFKEAQNDFRVVKHSAENLAPDLKISAYCFAICTIALFYLGLLLQMARLASWQNGAQERKERLNRELLVWRENYSNWLGNPNHLESAYGTVDFVKAMSKLVMFLAAPLVPILMLWQAMPGRRRKDSSESLTASNACLVLPQYVYKQAPANATFFTSRQFPWTLLIVVGSGVPAALTLCLYYLLGIDALLDYPSRDPQFRTLFVVVTLYIYSLGWCLSALFFRSYFTLPLGPDNNQYSIELTPELLHQTATEGWLQKFFSPHEGSYVRVMKWLEADSITYIDPRSEALLRSSSRAASQLFSKMQKSFPWLYALLNVFGRITDKMAEDSGTSDAVKVSGRNQFGSPESITIKLASLNRKDKARLFYAIRKWAPHLVIGADVQKVLVGSVVLNDPRYTHIWFDVLLPDKSALTPSLGVLNKGQTLKEGRYLVERKIDSGGQAIVYLAQDNLANNNVVLKEFILTSGESIEALVASAADFENETTVLSRLSHPQIVKFLDLFLQGHRVYIVLEYIRGESLRSKIETFGTLPEIKVVQLALQMCDILQYIHSQTPPVIHRDFTPENLILTPDGQLKLIDFSIAKPSKELASGDCAGKHAYTPPEQFRSEETPQSDIYALGATLYFLLTAEDPEPLSQSAPRSRQSEISEELNNIIRRCTALELSDRYEAISWLQLDLDKLLSQSS
jgi:tRNA A-37 threonylcarbamoyl transferase component Bud32